MPKFSVIIPAFNRASFLERTVASVLCQAETDFEIVIVDDGSTDDTADLAMSLAQRDQRVRIFRQQNAGPGPARNRGLVEATGQYIAFLDSDDLWFPWTLATYRSAIEKFDEPSLLFGAVRNFRDDSEVVGVDGSGPPEFGFYPNYVTANAPDAPHDFYRGSGVVCIKADVLRAAGGFVEADFYCEDLDLLLRLGEAPGMVVVRKPDMIAVRAHGEGSLSGLDRTARGVLYLIEQEKAGRYPGGEQGSAARRHSIAHHARFVSLALMKRGAVRGALRVWLRSIPWQLRFREFDFVLGLPACAIIPRLNPLTRASSEART